MRKNCARKWLHFTIDLLPLVVIPIFAIWSINHGDYTQETVINYKYQTNEVSSFDDLVFGNVYHYDSLTFDGGKMNIDEDVYINVVRYDYCENYLSAPYVDEILFEPYNAVSDNRFLIYLYDGGIALSFTNSNTYVSLVDEHGGYFNLFDFDFYITQGNDFYWEDIFETLPTSSTYNEIESVEVNDVGIGTAFYNALIDNTDKYFNFDNVFNFGAIKQWFNTNFFSGAMPPIINSLFNIIFYEFVTDIMMLIYMVFMFFIDFATDTLERFTGWSKRG